MPGKTAQELKQEIKKLILETLGITDLDPMKIDDDAPIFGGGNALTLDSVDALEIIMALQRNYHVRIADQNHGRYLLRSITSIAEFIQSEKDKQNS